MALLTHTKVCYPNQALDDEDTLKMWLVLWYELAEEYGLDMFKDAVKQLLKESEFLFNPATIGKRLQGMREIEREKAAKEYERRATMVCEVCLKTVKLIKDRVGWCEDCRAEYNARRKEEIERQLRGL